MRTIFTFIAVLTVLAPAVAGAQTARASQADSLLIRRNVYNELFAGIRLTPDRQARARFVIANVEQEQREVDALPTCAEQHRVWNTTTAQRDTALLTMVGNAADSATFRKRAATFMTGPCPAGHP